MTVMCFLQIPDRLEDTRKDWGYTSYIVGYIAVYTAFSEYIAPLLHPVLLRIDLDNKRMKKSQTYVKKS